MWVYIGNSTYATTDEQQSGFLHLSMERVNKGSEQFNMSLQITNVTLDVDYQYYYCGIEQQMSGMKWSGNKYMNVTVVSGNISLSLSLSLS